MAERPFKNKVALITGSGRGIGEAIARSFSILGANVAITHRKPGGASEARAQKVCTDIHDQGGRAIRIQCDISQKELVGKTLNEVEERFGRLDFLVLNAARAPFKPIERLLERELKNLVSVNYLGHIFCIQKSLPLLEKTKGKIVFISSLGGRFYSPSYPLGSMKAAMETVVRDCAESLSEKGISVNGVCGGLVKTDSFKTMRMYWEGIDRLPESLFVSPEEMANVAVFLCSPESKGIRGQILVVDRGLSNRLFRWFGA